MHVYQYFKHQYDKYGAYRAAIGAAILLTLAKA